MPWPTPSIPPFRQVSRVAAQALIRASARRFYVYVLLLPDGTPFYVGKGQGDRLFCHEKDALYARGQSHKLNTLQAILRAGGTLAYAVDSFHDSEADAHARECELIRLIGRRDMNNAGPLTNHTDGGEGCAGWSEEMRANHLATLGGVDCADPERATANQLFASLLPNQGSKPIKPISQFTLRPLTPINKPMGVTDRQCATLALSAIVNRVRLVPGCRLPRRMMVNNVACAIENGCGGDILKSGLARLSPDSQPKNETFILDEGGIRQIVSRVGEVRLKTHGVL